MSTMLLWVLAGLATVGGLVGVVAGFVGTTAPRTPRRFARGKGGGADHEASMRRRTRWAAAAVIGLGVWLFSGVFVGGVLAGLTVVGVPWLLSPTKNASVRIDKLEALGEWTQRLSDVLRLGMGLEQAMIASRRGAPSDLEHEIADLADRLQVGWRPAEALESFADALDDVTADKVLASLILCASDRGPGLAQALEDLSEAVREEVAKRRQIEADRAKPRTTVRWMTIITLCVVGAGFLTPSYTAPYGTFLGQLVLGLLAAGFAGVLAWMRSLADHKPVPRFLIADPRSRVKLPELPDPLQEVS
ncbi:type II secretion system F family protein [Streptomyces sp. NPDC096176]|uniref:type II secretion system F family protein n=1 Tax=Streptomyces sp. NPDC096176 TaxID=3366079 RepID=UPI00382DC54F